MSLYTTFNMGWPWGQQMITDPQSSAVRADFQQLVGQLDQVSERFGLMGVDFLLCLLAPDASQRMTADGAFATPS
jgi:hypothetical protein